MCKFDNEPPMLYSDWSANAQPSLDQMADVLGKLLHLGSNVLEWTRREHIKEPMPVDKSVVLMLYREVLVGADAVAILLKSRSCDPCAGVTRTMMEAWLSLQWILDSEPDQLQRARAYLIADRIRELHAIRGRIPGTSEFASRIAGKKSGDIDDSTVASVSETELRKREAEVVARLESPEWKPIADDLRARGNRTHWFAAFGGPPSFREMAVRLKKLGLYEDVYRALSSSVHATGAMKGMVVHAEGGGIAPLRLVEQSPHFFQLATTIGVGATCDIGKAYGTPERIKAINEYYIHEIRDEFFRLAYIRFIMPDDPKE